MTLFHNRTKQPIFVYCLYIPLPYVDQPKAVVQQKKTTSKKQTNQNVPLTLTSLISHKTHEVYNN